MWEREVYPFIIIGKGKKQNFMQGLQYAMLEMRLFVRQGPNYSVVQYSICLLCESEVHEMNKENKEVEEDEAKKMEEEEEGEEGEGEGEKEEQEEG